MRSNKGLYFVFQFIKELRPTFLYFTDPEWNFYKTELFTVVFQNILMALCAAMFALLLFVCGCKAFEGRIISYVTCLSSSSQFQFLKLHFRNCMINTVIYTLVSQENNNKKNVFYFSCKVCMCNWFGPFASFTQILYKGTKEV